MIRLVLPDRRAWVLLVLACYGWPWPGSTATPPVAATPSCAQAALLAERDAALPAGLLGAIGLVESGRPDATGGRVAAWPWTVNVAGQDRVFSNLAEAVEYVRERQRANVRSIDVGCFQINLMYHPDAFATLEQAFDPVANASYAARFLAALHRRGGEWAAAVALYHSATPELGGPYRDQVLARWQGGDSDLEKARGPRAGLAPVLDPFVVRLIGSPLPGVLVWRPASIPSLAGPSLAGPSLAGSVEVPPEIHVMPPIHADCLVPPRLPLVVTVSQ